MTQSQFFFVEFQEASEKPVEVLRVGKFIDMNLKPVEITEEDIDTFVANFNAGAAGQDVPIDIDHQKGEAGGWITKLERQGNKLLAWVDWNELGQKLVGEKVYKYLSATIDLSRKVLRAVSLVNFPAIKGLKPVELSEGITVIEPDYITPAQLQEAIDNLTEQIAAITPPADTNKDTTSSIPAEITEADDKEEQKKMDEKEKEQLREQIREEERTRVEAELKERQKTETELREQIRKEEMELAEAKMKRRQEFLQFADNLCNGEAGLAVDPEKVVNLLEALPDDQVEPTKEILKAKVVDFTEAGSEGNGKTQKPKLPDYARKDVIGEGLTVTQLFNARTLPGQMADYDLSEFSAEQIGA